jgi:hypothetical protein
VLRLSGADGSFFEMDIAGYQFPADVKSPLPEYDLNWLQVHIHARDSNGHEWEATDPCLLTWELAELAEWLGKHARGEDASSSIEFLEPCLCLEIVPVSNSKIALKLHLAYELCHSKEDATGMQSAVVCLGMMLEELENSIEDLTVSARAYPVRSNVSE